MPNHRYTTTSDNSSGESITVYRRISFFSTVMSTCVIYFLEWTKMFTFLKRGEYGNNYDKFFINVIILGLLSGVIYYFTSVLVSTKLWKFKIVRFLLDINTPIVMGKWDAMVKQAKMDTEKPNILGVEEPNKPNEDISNEEKCKNDFDDLGVFEIVQTWRTIGITLDSKQVSSKSVSAAIDITGNRISLEYQYIAEPIRVGENKRITSHRGAAVLKTRQEKHGGQPCPQLVYYTEDRKAGVIHLFPIGYGFDRHGRS